jgi:hypothetical protein
LLKVGVGLALAAVDDLAGIVFKPITGSSSMPASADKGMVKCSFTSLPIRRWTKAAPWSRKESGQPHDLAVAGAKLGVRGQEDQGSIKGQWASSPRQLSPGTRASSATATCHQARCDVPKSVVARTIWATANSRRA